MDHSTTQKEIKRQKSDTKYVLLLSLSLFFEENDFLSDVFTSLPGWNIILLRGSTDIQCSRFVVRWDVSVFDIHVAC